MTTFPTEYVFYFLYLLLVLTATIAETYTYGRWWQRNEFARWAMGIGTVLLFAIIPIAAGSDGVTTWLLIVVGFGLAGIVRGYREINDGNDEKQKRVDMAREQVRQAGDAKN